MPPLKKVLLAAAGAALAAAGLAAVPAEYRGTVMAALALLYLAVGAGILYWVERTWY